MAHLSNDEALIEAFHSGFDFHAATAARVFDVDPTEVTGEQRAKIKAMNYGLAYGLSAYGLSQQLRISTEEARALMDEYFLRFGGVRDYLHSVVERAAKEGYTETIFGRRRYLPDLTSTNRQRREMAERMALNAPIQGSAADIIKVAMLGVHRALAEAGLRSRVLLQVHDELMLEVADGGTPAVAGAGDGVGVRLSVLLEVSVGTAARGTTPLIEHREGETGGRQGRRTATHSGRADGFETTCSGSPVMQFPQPHPRRGGCSTTCVRSFTTAGR